MDLKEGTNHSVEHIVREPYLQSLERPEDGQRRSTAMTPLMELLWKEDQFERENFENNNKHDTRHRFVKETATETTPQYPEISEFANHAEKSIRRFRLWAQDVSGAHEM